MNPPLQAKIKYTVSLWRTVTIRIIQNLRTFLYTFDVVIWIDVQVFISTQSQLTNTRNDGQRRNKWWRWKTHQFNKVAHKVIKVSKDWAMRERGLIYLWQQLSNQHRRGKNGESDGVYKWWFTVLLPTEIVNRFIWQIWFDMMQCRKYYHNMKWTKKTSHKIQQSGQKIATIWIFFLHDYLHNLHDHTKKSSPRECISPFFYSNAASNIKITILRLMVREFYGAGLI